MLVKNKDKILPIFLGFLLKYPCEISGIAKNYKIAKILKKISQFNFNRKSRIPPQN